MFFPILQPSNERIGLSQSEVAELLGITPGRVGQIERRAMEKIRTLIETESRRAGCSAHDWMGV
jgi:DNA-directed RNA polymerase sigma subunit (sigma70/sigma32)